MLGSRVEVIEPRSHVIEVITVLGEPVPVIGAGQTARIVGTFVAATVLGGHRVVTTNDTGQLVYADHDDLTQRNRAMYLTEGAWDAGVTATVTAFGPVWDSSFDLIPGEPLYVGSNGLLTQLTPTTGYLRKVAFAAEVQGIWFDPQPPIVLS